MRVLRTVTIENSAATKNAFAPTSAASAASRHTMSVIGIPAIGRSGSGFPVADEVRVDEVVDHRLVLRIDGIELDAHTDAPIAPRHLALGVDVLLAAGHAEAHADPRARFERARRADRDAAVAQI